MNLAPPIPRFGRGPADPDATQIERARGTSAGRRTGRPAKNPTQVLQRERHDPDYLILMLVVALDRGRDPDGLLLVGDARLRLGGRRRVRHRRPAGPVGGAGPHRDGGDDARRLPLPASRARCRSSSCRWRCSCSCSCPTTTSSSAAPPAGSSSAGLPAIHPAEIAKLAHRHLPRPLVREAGREGRRLLGRHGAVPDHPRPGARARVQGARPRHDDGHRPDRRSRCSSSPARTCSTSRRWARRRSWR